MTRENSVRMKDLEAFVCTDWLHITFQVYPSWYPPNVNAPGPIITYFQVGLCVHWAQNLQSVSAYGGLSNFDSDRIFARHFEFFRRKLGLANVRISKQNTHI